MPLVSFCIPTYNRANLIRSNLMRLLEYKGNNIEVVIVNDNSTDSTHELLSKIKDKRFSYYKNKENINAVLNITRSIESAKGEWVFTLSDEDLITSDMVTDVVNIIHSFENKDAAVIFGNVKNDSGPYPYYIYHNGSDYIPYKYENIIFEMGDEAILAMGFDHKYLSGILMKKSLLAFDLVHKLSQKDGLIAPQTVLYTNALKFGKGITVDVDFCIKKVKSVGKSQVHKINNESYKHPLNRLKQFSLYVKMVNEIVNQREIKAKTISKLYGYYLDEGTYGWYRLLSSKSRASQFSVENLKVIDLAEHIPDFVNMADKILSEIIKDSFLLKEIRLLIDERISYFRQKRNIPAS